MGGHGLGRACSHIKDAPHSHIIGNSVLKACHAYVLLQRTLLTLVHQFVKVSLF